MNNKDILNSCTENEIKKIVNKLEEDNTYYLSINENNDPHIAMDTQDEYYIEGQKKYFAIKFVFKAIVKSRGAIYDNTLTVNQIKNKFKKLNILSYSHYYWVNQGQEYLNNKEYIQAPFTNLEGHRLIKNIKENDKILSYVSNQGGIFRILTATSQAEKFTKYNDDREWYRVKVKEEILSKAISLKNIQNNQINTMELDKNSIPWNRDYKKSKQKRYLINIGKKLYYDILNVKENPDRDKINTKGDDMPKNPPLNQILYGPPGTGKTYNTIIEAMKIIKPEIIEWKDINNKNLGVTNYEILKTEFDKLKNNDQIKFVTFHQSYSYEEFIEGIKPDLKNEKDLKYKIENGIFKQICINAKQNLYTNKNKELIKYASFEETITEFKNKYPEGSTYDTLHDITYTYNDYIGYKFGTQTQTRKIDLTKIKQIFDKNIDYTTAIEFNADYDGNPSLACYHYVFFKELINIKNDINNSIQTKISKDSGNMYVINDDAKKYVLIIDEINRGNISKIFGELITLIEKDKRIGNENKMTVTLPYSQQKDFGVPKNLYIIGTMNTSDRSIASVDIALRRRFKFIEMMPKPELFENVKIREFNTGKTEEKNKKGLKDLLECLNKRISILLDRDHQIGHSYFIQFQNKEEIDINDLKDVWFDEIIPLLNEYFYSDWEKLQAILGKAEEKNNSFIKIIKNVSFATTYSCDIEEKCDFNTECDFANAMEHAFNELYSKS